MSKWINEQPYTNFKGVKCEKGILFLGSTNAGTIISDSNYAAIHKRSTEGIVLWDGTTKSYLGQKTDTVTAGATADQINEGATVVTVTEGGDNSSLISLPEPQTGYEIMIITGGTGVKLASDTPASVAINKGSGASAGTVLPADGCFRCLAISSSDWFVTGYDYTTGSAYTVAAAS